MKQKFEGRCEDDVQATTGIGSAENANAMGGQDVPCSSTFRQDPLPLLAAFAICHLYMAAARGQGNALHAPRSMLHAPCGQRSGKAEG